MPMLFEGELKLNRSSLHEQIVGMLRKMILEGRLLPGQHIDEKMLCEQFEISRTPLREALKVLNSEGLVDLLPNRGARVAGTSPHLVSECFDAVAGLERTAAELAAEKASSEELEMLRKIQEEMEEYYRTNNEVDYFTVNDRAHALVVEFSGNSILVSMHARLMTKIRQARFAGLTVPNRWHESILEHREILDALVARDAARAGAAAMNHVMHTARLFKETHKLALAQ
jgi:DNA-binding GntR family transcriptional regulator